MPRRFPQGLVSEIIYDSTNFVNSSIDEVIYTLIEALLIVTAVVFAFLGSWRSVLIPVVAIPLSLIGVFTILLALGFSINLLTLLALVLAIGLVVDDAIIVVENVNRHLAEGTDPVRCGVAGGARACRTHRRHDDRADRRLCADRLPGRAHRRIVRRIRLHACGRRHGFGHRRADALAGELRLRAQGAGAGRETVETQNRRIHRPRMDAVGQRYHRLLDASLHYVPVTLTFGALVL